MDIKGFDIRSLQRWANPQAADDFNRFLESLPQNVGQTALIAAAIAWAAAGATGLYTTMQINSLIEKRAELAEMEALKPPVPKLIDKPVSKEVVEEFAKTLEDQYNLLNVSISGNTIVLKSNTYRAFGQFREAIGHIQNGGQGWRVQLDNLCVGRECDKEELGAALKINQVTVDLPQTQF